MLTAPWQNCGDVLTKKKLDLHRNKCSGASFTCLDCMVHFAGISYKSHTACITEDQKYQGKLYKEKKSKGQCYTNGFTARVSESPVNTAYTDDGTRQVKALAVVNVPPRCPTPPAVAYSLGYHRQPTLPSPNVFDFFEGSETPARRPAKPVDQSHILKHSLPLTCSRSQMSCNKDDMSYQVPDQVESIAKSGFSNGGNALSGSIICSDSFVTPVPKSKHITIKSRDDEVETTSNKTDRKRKRRNSSTELGISLSNPQDTAMPDAPPSFHTGLTGGLHRLFDQSELPPSPDGSEQFANSPLSPIKRAKHGSSKIQMRVDEDVRKRKRKEEKTLFKMRDLGLKRNKDKDHLHERERIERKNGTALVKVRPRKKGNEVNKDYRDQGHRQYYSPPSLSVDRIPAQAIEHIRSESQPLNNSQETGHPSIVDDAVNRAGLFITCITKGNDSERGISVNKALKRYHRERNNGCKHETSGFSEEKQLWKDLRLKKNDQGEIILFYPSRDTSQG